MTPFAVRRTLMRAPLLSLRLIGVTLMIAAAGCNSPEEVLRNPVVNISPTTVALKVGQQQQLTGSPVDGDGKPLSLGPITWTSDKPSVATVTINGGLVTAVAPGTAVITANAAGVTGGVIVTVSSQ